MTRKGQLITLSSHFNTPQGNIGLQLAALHTVLLIKYNHSTSTNPFKHGWSEAVIQEDLFNPPSNLVTFMYLNQPIHHTDHRYSCKSFVKARTIKLPELLPSVSSSGSVPVQPSPWQSCPSVPSSSCQ